MSWLDHLSINRKLLAGCSVSLALLAVVGLLGLQSGNAIDARADVEAELAQTSESLLQREVDHLEWVEAAGTFRTDPAVRGVEVSTDHRGCALGRWYYGEGRSVAEARVPELKPVLDRLEEPHRALHATAAQLDELLRAGDREEALGVFSGASVPRAAEVRSVLEESRGLLGEAVAASGEARAAALVRARWVTLGGLGVALVAAFLSSTWMARSLSRRLTEVGERARELKDRCITNLGCGADALAEGDLDRPVDYGTPLLESGARDEIGELARTVDDIIRRSVATIESFEAGRTVLKEAMGETRSLVVEARGGRLAERGDASRFRGAYADLVSGVNELLDAVVGPVNEATSVLERLAERDLTARMEGSYRGDHARIKEALNTAASNLETALAEVAAAADQVGGAADQISTGSQELAEGSSEQASSLEEISSSVQEMAAMAHQSAGNAKEAESAARKARTDAEEGEASMRRLSEAMERIQSSADATARIVKTIDEIAFQTNLLALNAAVEAARAGDAGKGFAVVAEEVRSLAMRSAEAARDTADLIEQAVSNTRGGVELNREVLERLGEIGRGNARVLEVVAEVAAASQQQSEGVEQVNTAIEQMNSVTQQVAANAEESASAAEELTSQAFEVKGLVGRFTLSVARQATDVPRVGAGRSSTGAPPAPAAGSEPRAAGKGHGSGPREGSPRVAAAMTASRLIPFDDDDVFQEF